MTKGAVCSKCGYVFRKWGVRCPLCRTYLKSTFEGREVEESEDWVENLLNKGIGEIAGYYLKKLEATR